MQSNTERWRPLIGVGGTNPSARLRAARSMPQWLQQTRGVPVPPPPPTPTLNHPQESEISQAIQHSNSTTPKTPNIDDTPSDPDYEVIDVPNQTYSNTPMTSTEIRVRRCDLCGSSAPSVQCSQCPQQNFCASCDDMYHRHPKRQSHVRKALDIRRVEVSRPPLPPKGEPASAPVPPPRRNKRAPTPTSHLASLQNIHQMAMMQQQTAPKKEVGLVGSLKRMITGRSLPPPPPVRDRSASLVPHHPMAFHNGQMAPGEFGMNEWEMARNQRMGSMSSLNMPQQFTPVGQAHSMAQLNCPTCWGGAHQHWGSQMALHHQHGGSQLGMQQGPPPWGYPTWDARRMRRHRRDSSGSEGDISPALSRRSSARHRLHSDSEEDEPLRRRPLSRRESGTDGFRGRRFDDETMSLRGHNDDDSESLRGGSKRQDSLRGSSRRRYRDDLSDRRRRDDDVISERSGRRRDDDIISERGGRRRDDDVISERGGRHRDDDIISERGGRRRDDDVISERGGRRRDEDLVSKRLNRRRDDDVTSDRSNSSRRRDDNTTGSERIGRKRDDDLSSDRSGSRIGDDSQSDRSFRRREEERKKQNGETLNERGYRRREDEISISRQVRGKSSVEDKMSTLKREDSDRRIKTSREISDRREDSRKQRGDFNNSIKSYDGSVDTTENSNDKSKLLQRRTDRFVDTGQVTRSTENGKNTSENASTKSDLSKSSTKSSIEENGKSDAQEPEEEQPCPIPTTEWECEHCTFVNQAGTRVCDVCCKTAIHPRVMKEPSPPLPSKSIATSSSSNSVDNMKTASNTSHQKKKEHQKEVTNGLLKSNKNLTSKGTSPPPQSISTQTYDVAGLKLKKNESEPAGRRRSLSKQSITSDTQSSPMSPPRSRSPGETDSQAESRASRGRNSDIARKSSRAGSQPTDYLNSLVQKQVKQGMEMVHLLREAEEHQFSAEDVAVALDHCGDGDPIEWLLQNWRNMIDTVVTLGTNYGHERKENTIGTISASEARDALRMHSGNVWAAVTECVQQRQKKYAELLSRGNFSREDIVTVLTAHHGNLEAAYLELSKGHLKPFLMRIWGPPQENDTPQQHDEEVVENIEDVPEEKEVDEVSVGSETTNRVESWLKQHVFRSLTETNLLRRKSEYDAKGKSMDFTEAKELRTRRRHSDVHRFLNQVFSANSNSLMIDQDKYSSLHNIVQKEPEKPFQALPEKYASCLNLNDTGKPDFKPKLYTKAESVNSDPVNESFYLNPPESIQKKEKDEEEEKIEEEEEQVYNGRLELFIQDQQTPKSKRKKRHHDIGSKLFMRKPFPHMEGFSKRAEKTKSVSVSSIIQPFKQRKPEVESSSFESATSEDEELVNISLQNANKDKVGIQTNASYLQENDLKNKSNKELIEAVNRIEKEIKALMADSHSREQNITSEVISNIPYIDDDDDNKSFNASLSEKQNKIRKHLLRVDDNSSDIRTESRLSTLASVTSIESESEDESSNGNSSQNSKDSLELMEEVHSKIWERKANSRQTIIDKQIIENQNQDNETHIIQNQKSRDEISPLTEIGEGNKTDAKNIEEQTIHIPIEESGGDYKNKDTENPPISLEVNVTKSDINNMDKAQNSGENKSTLNEKESQEKNLGEKKSKIPRRIQKKSVGLKLGAPFHATKIPDRIQTGRRGSGTLPKPAEQKQVKIIENNIIEAVDKPEIRQQTIKMGTPKVKKVPKLARAQEFHAPITIIELSEQTSTDYTQEQPKNEEKGGSASSPNEDKDGTTSSPKKDVRENLPKTEDQTPVQITLTETDEQPTNTEIINKPETTEKEENQEMAPAQQSDQSSSTSPSKFTAINLKPSKKLEDNRLSPVPDTEENSDQDVSPIPTDSEKEMVEKFEDALNTENQNDNTSLPINPDQQPSNSNSLEPNTSTAEKQTSVQSVVQEKREEVLTLIRESLSKESVLDRLVTTLFGVLQGPNQSEITGNLIHGSIAVTPESETDIFFEATEQPRQDHMLIEHKVISSINTNITGPATMIETSPAIEVSTSILESKEKMLKIETPKEREVRRLLAEGLVSTFSEGELAWQLMEMRFAQEEAIQASKECSTLQTAMAFLQQECPLCTNKCSMKQMVDMLECDHRCCLECAVNYFTLQINEASIWDCVCPYCRAPDLQSISQDQAHNYFSHLDIILKGFLKEQTHELFQRKLRDWTLSQDPNFRWCSKCSSGFIANPHQKRHMCPDCRTISCATCRRPWAKEHEGISCEQYSAWLKSNDPDNLLEKHLEEHGITCPKCQAKFSLAKGGCMHMTCSHCKHEFCSGCAKPFLMGDKCKVSEYCQRLGLHSHHPRNCLFYLRDKEPAILEKLLKDNGVNFSRKLDEPYPTKCPVNLLKEANDGLIDTVCSNPVESAGLCRKHYVEFLSRLIRGKRLETLGILGWEDLETIVRREGKKLPPHCYGTPTTVYEACLSKIVQEEVPLD